MAISQQEKPQDCRQLHEEEGDDDYSGSEGSDSEYVPDADLSDDILEETQDKLSSTLIKKKSKGRVGKAVDIEAECVEVEVGEVDEKSFKEVQKIIQAEEIEKLKLEQCKVYLRKHGLRLTGNKDTLIRRIKEHLEILNGGGEKKYPVSSFVLNCKGDACTGDVVMFQQKVYDMYSIVSRGASGPPCGIRTVAGRIVKESYGAAKQQHTFTIEVLWSEGEKPLPPLHPLLIKGRNLYRLKTLRQRWEDEEERCKVLMEKHSRGSMARCDRETRIQEKEKKKMLRENRASKKAGQRSKQSQLNPSLRPNSVDAREMPLQRHNPASTIGFGGGAQEQGSQPQKPELVNATKRVNHRPPQPGPFSDVLNKSKEQPAFHPQQQNGQRENDIRFQAPHNSVNHGGIVHEVHKHRNGDFYAWSTEFYLPTTKYADTSGKDDLSGNYNEPQLKSDRHFHPVSPPCRQPLKSMNQCQRPRSPAHCPNACPQPRSAVVKPVINQHSTSLARRPNVYPPRPMIPSHKQEKYRRSVRPDIHPPRTMIPSHRQEKYRRPVRPDIYPPRPISPSCRQEKCRRPVSPSYRQECSRLPSLGRQQVCRYYAQGRCYYGEDCKFQHDSRDFHVQIQ